MHIPYSTGAMAESGPASVTAGDPRLDEAFSSRSVRTEVVEVESKDNGGSEQGQQDGEREDEEVVAAGEEGDGEKDAEPDVAEEKEEGKSDVASASQTSRPQSIESDDAPVMKGVSYPRDEWIPRWDAD
jgi:hypothetical protein